MGSHFSCASVGNKENGLKLSFRPSGLRADSGSGGCGAGESGFRLLHQLGKAGCIMHGDVGQDLAIQLDAGLLEPVDELGVTGAIQLAGGVDAHDPQGAELALLLFAAGVSELEAAFDGFLGSLVELRFCEEVTACPLKNLLAAV